MNDNNQWHTPIEKLMLWQKNSWILYYEPRCLLLTLRIHYDQMMIFAGEKVLESFNIHNKIKGIYKNDIVILIIGGPGSQEIRKLKFQIKGDVEQCLQKLGEHFPVINHNGMRLKNTIKPKYRNISEVLKQALENKEFESSSAMLPPFEYANMIKTCLLDPTFIETVCETSKILQGIHDSI